MIASAGTVLTAEPRLVLDPSIALFVTVLYSTSSPTACAGTRARDETPGAEQALTSSARAPAASAAALADASLLGVSDLRVDFHAAGRHVRPVDGLHYEIEREQTVAMIGDPAAARPSARARDGAPAWTAHVSGSIGSRAASSSASPSAAARVRGRSIAMVFQVRRARSTRRCAWASRSSSRRAHDEVGRGAARELARIHAARPPAGGRRALPRVPPPALRRMRHA